MKYTDPDGRDVEDSIELTSVQKDKVQQAQKDAIFKIDQILDSLTTGDEKVSKSAQDYLGLDITKKSDFSKLKNNLLKIKEDLSSMDITDYKFDPKPSDSQQAGYVITKGHRVLYGDSLFEKTIYLTSTGLSNNLTNTLLHETSHKALNLTSRNEIYGEKNCKNLQNSMKVSNASNWAYFIGSKK